MARLDSDAEVEVRSALGTFEALGSRRAARLVANTLRELGARVPRGPNAAIEVVALLAEGLRHAELAERLPNFTDERQTTKRWGTLPMSR